MPDLGTCFKLQLELTFLANVNHVHVRYMLSPVRLSVVCITFVRPTQPVEVFGSLMFLHHLVLWPSADIHRKFHGDRPRGTPPSGNGGGVNARGIAKYSDFGPIEGYISETVQELSYY